MKVAGIASSPPSSCADRTTARVEPIQRGPIALGNGTEACTGVEASQQRVHPKTQLELPRAAPCVPVDRNVKRFEFNEFRRNSQMNSAFAQAFAHERELPGLEIAKAAMDQFTGATGCAARQRTLLDEQTRITGGRDGLKYAGTVNAAAHDDHIVFFHLIFTMRE